MIEWNSIEKEGNPPVMKPLIVTALDDNGSRYVDYDIRFLDADAMKKERYCDDFIAQNPNGTWEFAYELGADYWETYDGKIVAWAYPDAIEPYQGA